MPEEVILEGGSYISCEQYADRTGVSVATVKRHCINGVISAKKFGRSWIIPTKSLPVKENSK